MKTNNSNASCLYGDVKYCRSGKFFWTSIYLQNKEDISRLITNLRRLHKGEVGHVHLFGKMNNRGGLTSEIIFHGTNESVIERKLAMDGHRTIAEALGALKPVKRKS